MLTPRIDSSSYAYGSRLAPLSNEEIEAMARQNRAEAIANVIVAATNGVKTLAARFKAYAKRQRALDELSALDDAMLRDIGLNCSEITAAVDGQLFRPAAASNENTIRKLQVVSGHAA